MPVSSVGFGWWAQNNNLSNLKTGLPISQNYVSINYNENLKLYEILNYSCLQLQFSTSYFYLIILMFSQFTAFRFLNICDFSASIFHSLSVLPSPSPNCENCMLQTMFLHILCTYIYLLLYSKHIKWRLRENTDIPSLSGN